MGPVRCGVWPLSCCILIGWFAMVVPLSMGLTALLRMVPMPGLLIDWVRV